MDVKEKSLFLIGAKTDFRQNHHHARHLSLLQLAGGSCNLISKI